MGREELERPVHVDGPQELARIGEGLTGMSSALGRERRAGEARQRELERKNNFVELLGAIAAAANEAPTVEEAFAFTVGRIGAHTGSPVGHAYCREPGGRFKSMDVWHLDDPERFASFKEATQDESFDITPATSSARCWSGPRADRNWKRPTRS